MLQPLIGLNTYWSCKLAGCIHDLEIILSNIILRIEVADIGLKKERYNGLVILEHVQLWHIATVFQDYPLRKNN